MELKFKNKLCIIGIGGLGRDILCYYLDYIAHDVTNYFTDVCFMVDEEYYKEPTVMDVPVITFKDFDSNEYQVIIAISDPVGRANIVKKLPKHTQYFTFIHPSVIKTKWVEIGEGSIIMAGSILSCNVKIGKHSLLNIHTAIGHDCEIGNFFTAAPGVKVSGNCIIDNFVYLGTNVCIREKLKITNNVVIGMGGVVVKDVVDKGTYIGNPLKKLRG